MPHVAPTSWVLLYLSITLIIMTLSSINSWSSIPTIKIMKSSSKYSLLSKWNW
nr:ATP synthase F0 subunit 8 [Lumbriculus variegatus]UZT67750.1 ATP synthase F0 subunit 8 [Lumbriculus variegatus]